MFHSFYHHTTQPTNHYIPMLSPPIILHFVTISPLSHSHPTFTHSFITPHSSFTPPSLSMPFISHHLLISSQCPSHHITSSSPLNRLHITSSPLTHPPLPRTCGRCCVWGGGVVCPGGWGTSPALRRSWHTHGTRRQKAKTRTADERAEKWTWMRTRRKEKTRTRMRMRTRSNSFRRLRISFISFFFLIYVIAFFKKAFSLLSFIYTKYSPFPSPFSFFSSSFLLFMHSPHF